MYWAQAISQNTADPDLATRFATVAADLADNENKIIAELEAAQGPAVDIGGYYNPSDELASAAMRPSATLNSIIDAI